MFFLRDSLGLDPLQGYHRWQSYGRKYSHVRPPPQGTPHTSVTSSHLLCPKRQSDIGGHLFCSQGVMPQLGALVHGILLGASSTLSVLVDPKNNQDLLAERLHLFVCLEWRHFDHHQTPDHALELFILSKLLYSLNFMLETVAFLMRNLLISGGLF